MLYVHRYLTHAIYEYDVSVHRENRAKYIDTLSACHPLTNDSLLFVMVGYKTTCILLISDHYIDWSLICHFPTNVLSLCLISVLFDITALIVHEYKW